jgi:hypothetical protein
MAVRKFVVGAYWGGLLACAVVLLPLLMLRPAILPAAYLPHLNDMVPVLVLAGFALLTSVLAAGTMLILRELAALRAALDRAATLPATLPAKLSHWTGMSHIGQDKATHSCPACRRTNWTNALVCVDCGTPLAPDGSAAAH